MLTTCKMMVSAHHPTPSKLVKMHFCSLNSNMTDSHNQDIASFGIVLPAWALLQMVVTTMYKSGPEMHFHDNWYYTVCTDLQVTLHSSVCVVMATQPQFPQNGFLFVPAHDHMPSPGPHQETLERQSCCSSSNEGQHWAQPPSCLSGRPFCVSLCSG